MRTPLTPNYVYAACSRWAWTNNERFSLAHATCLSAALGSAYTVRISIRPVGCSLHTCTPSHNATAAWPDLLPATCSVPKPLLMLAGIRWCAYSQIDGSRSAADTRGGRGGGEGGGLSGTGRSLALGAPQCQSPNSAQHLSYLG